MPVSTQYMTAVVRFFLQIKTKLIAYLMLLLFYYQPSKYTLSRKQRCTSDGVPGIGWTDEGIEKYNEFYDLVAKDRASNGASFNRALLSVYTERRRIASNKLPRGIALVTQRAIPCDDLDHLGGDEELLLEDCVYEQQSTPVLKTSKSRCGRTVQ
jgi:hypothetical protein